MTSWSLTPSPRSQPGYLDGYMAGQWAAAEQLLSKLNQRVGPLRVTDLYAMLMEYRPQPPKD